MAKQWSDKLMDQYGFVYVLVPLRQKGCIWFLDKGAGCILSAFLKAVYVLKSFLSVFLYPLGYCLHHFFLNGRFQNAILFNCAF